MNAATVLDPLEELLRRNQPPRGDESWEPIIVPVVETGRGEALALPPVFVVVTNRCSVKVLVPVVGKVP